MTAEWLVECLKTINWTTNLLAEVFGCDEDLVDAWVIGFEDIPAEAVAWIETLARIHQGIEP